METLIRLAPFLAYVTVLMVSLYFLMLHWRYGVVKYKDKFLVVKKEGFGPGTIPRFYMDEDRIQNVHIRRQHREGVPWTLIEEFAEKYNTKAEAKAFAEKVKRDDKARRRAKRKSEKFV